jgi:archaemetzincin
VIQVLPLGQVAREDLAVVSAAIESRFGCRCEMLPPVPLPAHAWHPLRAQYDSDSLLEHLFDRLAVDVMRIIGVTGADLFAEGRNFVFGYAHMRDRVAVFSTLRLRERWWGRAEDDALYRSRIDKALTHEIGHTFHVPHCPRARCVMHQVEFLWQLDELDARYCPSCEQKVHAVAQRGVDGAEALFDLAGSYMRRRRFGRAAATYAAALERDPANPHFWNDHGVALLALGDRGAAARSFRKAVDLAPGFPHAWYNLGIVSRERGDTRTADYFFQEAVRRDDDPRAAYRYLAMLYRDYFHDPERAASYLERYRALSGLTLAQRSSTPLVTTESTAPV